MSTDEEKWRLSKLLDGLDVPELKLTEQSNELVKMFKEKFGQGVEEEFTQEVVETQPTQNPYKVDPDLLKEISRKLFALQSQSKCDRQSKQSLLSKSDPKRPWRINNNQEKLLRINNEIKRHVDKGSDLINPLSQEELHALIAQCEKDSSVPGNEMDIMEAVSAAKKHLPNFQYRKIENSTAVEIVNKMSEASLRNK